MTEKAAFNAEEWSVVTGAPFLVGLLVVAADRGGTVRESVAISKAYAAARERHAGGLLGAVVSTPPSLDSGSAPRTPEALRHDALETLREAVGILERVALPDEVVGYKELVRSVGDAVARAHREGGFLGIGGTEVSEHEQAALDEVGAVLS